MTAESCDVTVIYGGIDGESDGAVETDGSDVGLVVGMNEGVGGVGLDGSVDGAFVGLFVGFAVECLNVGCGGVGFDCAVVGV